MPLEGSLRDTPQFMDTTGPPPVPLPGMASAAARHRVREAAKAAAPPGHQATAGLAGPNGTSKAMEVGGVASKGATVIKVGGGVPRGSHELADKAAERRRLEGRVSRDPTLGVPDVTQLLSLSEESVMQNTMVRSPPPPIPPPHSCLSPLQTPPSALRPPPSPPHRMAQSTPHPTRARAGAFRP